MTQFVPVVLEGRGVRLEPMALAHVEELARAVEDGRLWELWYTMVPRPEGVRAYVESALAAQARGERAPWVVRELVSGIVVGSTSYHDIVADVPRVEVGYTWYAQSRQRTGLNTSCKLLLFERAFDVLGCRVVGLRTDGFNLRSQKAIEALGAKRDGVVRRARSRPDGSVRDTVMYSILSEEWPDVRRHLELRLARHA